jgi:transposase
VRRPAPRALGQAACRKAYDHRRCRQACRRRGITPWIAGRGVESSKRLGRHRWVVERTLAWFVRFRRLTVRCEHRADILEALHRLTAALICLRFVERWSCWTRSGGHAFRSAAGSGRNRRQARGFCRLARSNGRDDVMHARSERLPLAASVPLVVLQAVCP